METKEGTLRNIIFPQNMAHPLIKGKVHLVTGHEGAEEEYRYSSTLSLTLAQDGGGWSMQALAALPPGKTRYLLYRMLG
jgi:hypothetical protein